MQNAFASKNGMLDIAGADLSGAPRVIDVIGQVLSAARRSGMPVVYLQMGYKTDLSDSGGPQSPNWHKELGIRMMNCRPELKGKLVTEGTWDFAIVDQLAPQPGDMVIVKTRYSGFARTALDAELQARSVRYLFFTGLYRDCDQCMRGIHAARRVFPGLLADSHQGRDHGRGSALDAGSYLVQH